MMMVEKAVFGFLDMKMKRRNKKKRKVTLIDVQEEFQHMKIFKNPIKISLEDASSPYIINNFRKKNMETTIHQKDLMMVEKAVFGFLDIFVKLEVVWLLNHYLILSLKLLEEEKEDSESTADQILWNLIDYDYGIACTEHFSFEDGSKYSPIHDHEMTLSQLESELFPISQSSEYTPSLVIESPTDFSERSPESTPPAYFSFLSHYTKQLCKLSSSEDVTVSGRAKEEYSEEVTLLRFEDELHEESYQRFRSRERNLVLHDYAEKYYLTTDYGDLLLKQRMVMVNWLGRCPCFRKTILCFRKMKMKMEGRECVFFFF